MKYVFPLFLGVLMVACNYQNDAANNANPKKPSDSELTLYMRHLEHQAQTWRDSVLAGHTVTWNPTMIDSMFTAVPTDGKIGDSLLFDNLGKAFKKEVQDLSIASTQDLSTHYNLMVTACVNCHRNFCPGPIKRIEKLRIPE